MKLILDGIIYSLQRQGGISVYFNELVAGLSRAGEEVELVTFAPFLGIPIGVSGIRHTTVPSRLLERYRPFSLPAGWSSDMIFHSSYYRVPSKRSIPTAVTVHDFNYERCQRGPRQWVHTVQKNAAIRAAQAVICISESTKQDLLEFVGETPGQTIHVIHNGVSDIFKRQSLGPSVKPYVLFVGQRGGYKNFRLAVDAIAMLPELELHCVGGGALHPKELQGLPDSVAMRIRHLGFVTDEELNVSYNRAVCLVYPSSYEGFGIPVVEAMRAGCPVVSMDCKAVLEVGRDALTIAAADDPRAMADAILKTVSSERSSLVLKGLAVAQAYSWDATHRQTLEVYRSLGA